MRVELLVGLKVPDTTEITAFNALKNLGYSIRKLERLLYFEFELANVEKADEIARTDILVNVNKNTFELKGDGRIIKSTHAWKAHGPKILIESQDNDSDGLIESLKNLGFDIKVARKGILWIIEGLSDTEAKLVTEGLLYNKHYQRYTFLR